MSEVLKIVLSLSLSGTILMTVLFALKPLYKNRMSKTWQYYIWLVIIARMLLPFTPETTLIGSAFNHLEYDIANTVAIAPTQNDPQSDSMAEGLPIVREIEMPQLNETTATQTFNQDIFNLLKNIWIIWVVIALVLLVRKITMYQSFVRYVKAGCVEISNIEILNLLAQKGEELRIKKPIELYTNYLISSPMLIGFFRPFIVFPNAHMKQLEMQYIITHELTHFKRLDMLYKWLVQITICLHWFNPFIYLMGNEISNCCELSCDEAIVRSLDIKEKKTYGNTLLASLESAGKYKNTHASVTLTQSAELIKERLDAIMTFKRKSKLITAVTIILTLLLLTGTAGIGAYAAPKVSSPSTSHTPIEKSQDSDTQTTKNSAASTKAYDKEYANWNITVKENDYYYKESLVRIFMDLRNDGSFENSFVNDNGAIDIKLIRNRAGSIISVEQIDEQEANEILEDFDISQDSIERLTKNDLPSNILAALNECTEKSWYVLEDSKTQYIYYAALPRDYSFQIDGSSLSIYDIGKKTGHYVLLAVPKTSGLIINYNSKAVTFTRISL